MIETLIAPAFAKPYRPKIVPAEPITRLKRCNTVGNVTVKAGVAKPQVRVVFSVRPEKVATGGFPEGRPVCSGV